MKKFITTTAAAALLLSAGCASIISGSEQLITVTSNVEGADVIIVDLKKNKEYPLGKTPFTGKAPRLGMAKLVVKKVGYKTSELALASSTNMVTLGNILSGGTFGTSTDSSTGAIYEYSVSQYLANLEPASTATELEQFKRESPIRVFAVMNYDRIGADVAAGNGSYLNSLYSLMNADTAPAKATAFEAIKNAYASEDSIPAFANILAKRK